MRYQLLRQILAGLVIGLLLAPPTQAQRRFRIEKRVFKMGINFVDVATENSLLPDRQLKPVFNLGFAADFRLAGPLALRVGGQYQPRGFRYKTNFPEGSVNTNVSLHYLDVPIDLVFTAGGRTKFYASAGGYVGLGVYGTTIQKAKGFQFVVEGDSLSTRREPAFGSDKLKRWDYGLNVALGFERNDTQFGITYGHGLANLSPVNDAAIRNRSLGIFLAYRFDGM
ncbi:MAG: outer membrane beta-barrel protein [Sphingobacteriaceae bacterium]|nr:outer membrane beta-barrel protein [Cytophagaceae bacterium]